MELKLLKLMERSFRGPEKKGVTVVNARGNKAVDEPTMLSIKLSNLDNVDLVPLRNNYVLSEPGLNIR